MQIQAINLEIQRHGPTAKLLLQGHPIGHEVPITLEELDGLIAEFVHVAATWHAEKAEVTT